MQSAIVCLLFLGIVSLHNASGQDEPTAEEKAIGQAIADKLKSLTKATASGGLSRSMSAVGGIARKKSALSGGTQYIDLLLVVDNSGSIGAKPFEDSKDATEKVVDFINSQATFSPTGSRSALIEFSSPRLTNLVFGLGDKPYAYDAKHAINTLGYDRGGSTATALALGKAKTEFQQNPSSRNAKVIWFFSDGRSNTGGSPVPVAKQLKAMGVTICSMAIGSRVNMKEINDISSSGCVYKAQTTKAYKRIMKYAFQKRGPSAAAPVLNAGFFKGIKF